jgi:hypothetical protein
MARWTLATAALATLVALPAAGQERPILRPTRDLTAEYHVQAPGPNGEPQTRTIRMYWTGQGTRLRLETEGQPDYALIDYAARRMTMVMLSQKSYAEVMFDADHAPGLNIPTGATIDRAGKDTIAGFTCTEWQMKGPQGGGTACITDDGVLLRIRGDQPGQAAAMEAVSVTYGAQPASLFAVPSGLRQVAPQ